MNEPNWIDQFLVNAALIGAWITGEAGRASLAGAAGGLVRWLMSERKRLRDGVVSILAGALMARYATPLMIAIIERHLGPLSGDVEGTAGFAAGIVGMSIAKLVMGVIEARAKRLSDGDQPDA